MKSLLDIKFDRQFVKCEGKCNYTKQKQKRRWDIKRHYNLVPRIFALGERKKKPGNEVGEKIYTPN